MIQPIYRRIRTIALGALTGFSRKLPLWKNEPAKEVFPALLSLKVARPLNIENLPEKFARQFIPKKSIPPRRIFPLQNVYVSGQAVVFKNFRVFVPSLTWLRDIELFRSADLFTRQWKKNIVVIPKETPFALVYDDWSAANYYHWMIEALPKILIAQAYDPTVSFIVPGPTPGFIKTSLELMGIQHVLYLTRHRSEVIKVSNLLLPELIYYEEEEAEVLSEKYNQPLQAASMQPREQLDFDPKKELIIAVREKLLRHKGLLPRPTRRLYISRSNQQLRRLANENDLLPVLEKYGFKIGYFEGKTLEEQMQLMLETEVFVSLHGSNMVNILFLQQGCRVIEMMNQDYVNDAYYLLASSLQLPYYSMPCTMTQAPGANADRVALNDADVSVDIAALELLLKQAVQGGATML
ncbi:MAG: glycosyltransferase family 61 protein [Bacteroidota bacterium]